MSTQLDETLSRPADTGNIGGGIRSKGFFSEDLRSVDSAVAEAVAAELDRQQNQIELIASENIVSKAVLEAQGSVLTN